MKTLLTLLLGTMLTGMLAMTTMQPAQADQAAATRNTLVAAAALLAGIAIETNVAHKRQLANTVEGYLPDGSTVYQDGHVVLPDGQSYYPSNYGQTVACNSGSCYVSGGQNYNGYNGYPPYNNPTNGPYSGYNTSTYNNYGSATDNDGDEYNQTAYNNTSYQNVGRTYAHRQRRNHH